MHAHRTSGHPQSPQCMRPMHAGYIREVRGNNLMDMDIWQHHEKQVLGSCPGWCQINKWPGSWAPEWVPALLLLVEEAGEVFLVDLVNLGRFPHVVEFRPVVLADEDEPGWLPAAPPPAAATAT